MYSVIISAAAELDLVHLRKHDKTNYIKCFDLVRELFTDPRKGTGKPERLKYFEGEVYSRRVNQTDRMMYVIKESTKEIVISSFCSHYKKI
jgi:toxin YoeB